ncbi:MAG: zinc-binding dehydrogenase, partial [Bryobacteraceae bacterium]
LGTLAIQLVRHGGGTPVAVVSSEERANYCISLGAVAINRSHFPMLDYSIVNNDAALNVWTEEVRRFGKAIWAAVGERRAPRIVLEHSGMSTLPASLFLCDSGGMVVTCGATTGYLAQIDLRYLWMRQKRLQGSHFATPGDCEAFLDLVAKGAVLPCLGQTFEFAEVGKAHQLLSENRQSPGSMVVLVNARYSSSA